MRSRHDGRNYPHTAIVLKEHTGGLALFSDPSRSLPSIWLLKFIERLATSSIQMPGRFIDVEHLTTFFGIHCKVKSIVAKTTHILLLDGKFLHRHRVCEQCPWRPNQQQHRTRIKSHRERTPSRNSVLVFSLTSPSLLPIRSTVCSTLVLLFYHCSLPRFN